VKDRVLRALILWSGLAVFAAAAGSPTLGWGASSETFMEHLRFLASDELRGRGNGSAELEEAARYIANHFEKYGLLPAGDEGTFFQEFEFAVGQELGDSNRVRFQLDPELVTLRPEEDYIPLTSGGERGIQGDLVFAGFGITAPELEYDDYRNVDVTGKVVVILEHEPQEKSDESIFSGRDLTPYSTLLHKIINARTHGAVGVILVPDTFHHRDDQAPLPEWSRIEDLGIHSIQLSARQGEWLVRMAGRDLQEIGDWINTHMAPISFHFQFPVHLELDAVMVRHRIRNVAGFLPGLEDQVIVIGAHYDHLGLGHTGSLADAVGQVHNGADDNASGTAGLLELARLFKEKSLEKGLLFLAFSGEEMGLMGSRYYTDHPTIPLDETIVMINLDMIGRSEGELQVGGVGTAAVFREILKGIEEKSILEFSYFDNSRGSSDHFSFSLKRIPSLFFFSGLHSDYHRPSDDWERINQETMGEILEVAREAVEELSRVQGRIEYADAGPSMPRQGMGGRIRPLFGVFPDTNWTLGGVRLERILAGSPAEKAGLLAGDILVRLNDKVIANVDEFTSLVRRRRPGDQVWVEALRRGEALSVEVNLGSR